MDSVIDNDNSSTLAQDADCRIRWHGMFHSPQWEKQYRIHELPESIKIARVFVVIATVAFLVFLVNDYHFFGVSAMLGWMVALRGVVILATVLALWLIRDGMAPRKFDGIVIVWALGLKVAMLTVVATRPTGFVGHTIVTVLSILLTYWILPIPLLWRALAAWFMTAGVLLLGFWINPWPDQSTATAVTLALLLTNVMGGEMCREQQIWRRQQFLTLWRQQELSANLERALGEIKTLRGILPICTHCKRIWNDAGRWEPVEVYVRQHSHAEFTHGLCPECARSQYPEIDWEKSRRQREQQAKANERGG